MSILFRSRIVQIVSVYFLEIFNSGCIAIDTLCILIDIGVISLYCFCIAGNSVHVFAYIVDILSKDFLYSVQVLCIAFVVAFVRLLFNIFVL